MTLQVHLFYKSDTIIQICFTTVDLSQLVMVQRIAGVLLAIKVLVQKIKP